MTEYAQLPFLGLEMLPVAGPLLLLENLKALGFRWTEWGSQVPLPPLLRLKPEPANRPPLVLGSNGTRSGVNAFGEGRRR